MLLLLPFFCLLLIMFVAAEVVSFIISISLSFDSHLVVVVVVVVVVLVGVIGGLVLRTMVSDSVIVI